MHRRSLLLSLLATPALAQAPWSPSRPVRLIAPYAPGGGVDTAARLLAPPMGGRSASRWSWRTAAAPAARSARRRWRARRPTD
jgi:tripartite-type tricarboxylate transporter receptor subunit TctC